MRFRVRSLASLSGLNSGVAMRCGVGHRCGSDLALLWLWCRLAAVALIQPLAWEPLYAVGVALKRWEKKKKEMQFKFFNSIFLRLCIFFFFFERHS